MTAPQAAAFSTANKTTKMPLKIAAQNGVYLFCPPPPLKNRR
ncbi:MAG: hypothetical protein ACR2QC_05915 [Gammaproteobacteria bacterium]